MGSTDDLSALKRVRSRAETTKNDDFEALLFKLLPKVMHYADHEVLEFRTEAMGIISDALRRVKSLKLRLPFSSLCDQLCWNCKPFAGSLCITCLDVGVHYELRDHQGSVISECDPEVDTARAIVRALARLQLEQGAQEAGPLQCRMQGGLCFYALKLLPFLSLALNRAR